MKRVGIWAVALIGCVAACNKEEPAGPSPQPEKETTVYIVVSDAWDPDYSPDGVSLVYVEAYHLGLINLHTKQERDITPDYGLLEHCPRSPAWLVGDVIAFVRKDETTDFNYIYTVPAAGGTIVRYDAQPDPDGSLCGDASGRYVYYTDGSDQLIYRLDLVTGDRVRMTGEHMTGFAHFDPVLKPGSSNLYFEERAYPFDPDRHLEYIDDVATSGAGIPRLVFQTEKPFLAGLDVSPDGKYVVYPYKAGLFALEINTGEETWLTQSPDEWEAKDAQPSYAPDGQHITYTRHNNVYICDAL